jgi:hypothetical protein
MIPVAIVSLHMASIIPMTIPPLSVAAMVPAIIAPTIVTLLILTRVPVLRVTLRTAIGPVALLATPIVAIVATIERAPLVLNVAALTVMIATIGLRDRRTDGQHRNHDQSHYSAGHRVLLEPQAAAFMAALWRTQTDRKLNAQKRRLLATAR